MRDRGGRERKGERGGRERERADTEREREERERELLTKSMELGKPCGPVWTDRYTAVVV